MKIGLLLPSIIMSQRFRERIFAPRELYLWLIDELVTRGHEVYVYSSSGIETKGRVISGDTFLEENDLSLGKNGGRDKESLKPITQAINTIEYEIDLVSKAFVDATEGKIDILHAYHSPMAHYFERLSKVPVVYTLHDPVFPPDTLESTRLKKFREHTYIAISNSQKEQYCQSFNLNVVSTIHHGVKIAEFDYSEEADNYACFMGRYLPEKGVQEALHVALAEGIPLKLASSTNYKHTDYYRTEIQPLIGKNGIEELPFLFPKSRNEVLSRAKFLFFPIKWEEPFGMVMLEAMASGTPVIAYGRGAVPEIIKDGETGFIVNQDAEHLSANYFIKKTGTDGLREAVQRILSLPDNDYRKMRQASRKRVESEFSSAIMAQKHEEVYRSLLHR